MQSKPNFLNTQMNVSAVTIRDYVNMPLHRTSKANPKQTQSKPNFRKAKMRKASKHKCLLTLNLNNEADET